MFHLLQTYVALKRFILQVLRVLEVCSGIHWGHGRGTASRGPPDGAHDPPRILQTGVPAGEQELHA
jgi:hypothetical protein